MKKVFQDKYRMECTFSDAGILFRNSRRVTYYPYGCLESINLSFMGVMQAVSRAQVCCFIVSRENKAEIKELLKKTRAAMQSAPAAEPVVVDLEKLPVDQSLPAEEQLQQFKTLYVQGVITKDQQRLMKEILAEA